MRLRQSSRSLATYAIVAIVTLAALEIVLRVADFRELREGVTERSLSYRYDAELGWFPSGIQLPRNQRAHGCGHA